MHTIAAAAAVGPFAFPARQGRRPARLRLPTGRVMDDPCARRISNRWNVWGGRGRVRRFERSVFRVDGARIARALIDEVHGRRTEITGTDRHRDARVRDVHADGRGRTRVDPQQGYGCGRSDGRRRHTGERRRRTIVVK